MSSIDRRVKYPIKQNKNNAVHSKIIQSSSIQQRPDPPIYKDTRETNKEGLWHTEGRSVNAGVWGGRYQLPVEYKWHRRIRPIGKHCQKRQVQKLDGDQHIQQANQTGSIRHNHQRQYSNTHAQAKGRGMGENPDIMVNTKGFPERSVGEHERRTWWMMIQLGYIPYVST